MPQILPTSATIGEVIGDYYPVFYKAAAWSAQAATFRHTD